VTLPANPTKPVSTGRTFRSVLLPIAALLFASTMLSACVVEEPGYDHHGWWWWHHHDEH
jgi:hypothetical protein